MEGLHRCALSAGEGFVRWSLSRVVHSPCREGEGVSTWAGDAPPSTSETSPAGRHCDAASTSGRRLAALLASGTRGKLGLALRSAADRCDPLSTGRQVRRRVPPARLSGGGRLASSGWGTVTVEYEPTRRRLPLSPSACRRRWRRSRRRRPLESAAGASPPRAACCRAARRPAGTRRSGGAVILRGGNRHRRRSACAALPRRSLRTGNVAYLIETAQEEAAARGRPAGG